MTWHQKVYAAILLFFLSAFLTQAEITVAVINGAIPMIFTNDEGKADGLFAQLLRDIIHPQELHFITNLSFEEAYRKVKNGEIDIIPAFNKTDERQEFFTFNQEVVMVSWSELFVDPDTYITNFFDLEGEKIALMEAGQNGNNFVKLMSDFDIPFEPVYYHDYPCTTDAVLDGEVMGLVSFSSFARTELRLKPSGIVFSPAQTFFATAKAGDKATMDLIDKKLREWKQDPQSPYNEALHRWLLRDTVEKTPEWIKRSLVFLSFLLMVVTVVLLLQRIHLKRIRKLNREQQKDLEKAERQYSLYVKNSNDLIWAVDAESRLTFLNLRAADILGIDVDSWIGRSMNPLVIEKDLPRLEAITQDALEGRSTLYELHIRDNGGRIKTFSVTTNPIFDDGILRGAISFAKDMTSQKEMELQIQKSQRMEALGALTSGIAHDFNNLLTPIIGYAEILKMRLNAEHPEQDKISNILQAGFKARELVKRLLVFSKKQELQYQDVCLNTMVDSFLPILEKSLKEDMRLKIDKPISLPLVMADPGQLEQVVLNLVVNSRDAMPEGGEITISTRLCDDLAGEVQGEFPTKPGTYCALSVADTGTGMSREVIEKVFDPSFSTKGENGTGLGLATSFGIIKQHKGYIHVKSEMGSGATFTIYLPVDVEKLN